MLVYHNLPALARMIYFAVMRDQFQGPLRRSAMFEMQAEVVIAFNVAWRSFTIKKSRSQSPYEKGTCRKLVKQYLNVDLTDDGMWSNPADETIFLLKYSGNNLEITVDN